MTKPLISIVIANYNYGRFLDEAIQSVIAQDMGDKVELIICDAASTDNSVEIIRKYAGGLPPNTARSEWDNAQSQDSQLSTHNSKLISWWCSEKDGGQSAAFNKGFSHARGEWLTWLNADDLYFPGALKAFSSLVAKRPKAEWITGNKVHFNDKTGRVVRVHWGPNVMPPFLSGNRASSGVYGPTAFWRHDLYIKLGGIDERMHYAMDTEYWARFTMAGVRQTRLRCFCWAFRDHEESKTSGEQSSEVAEKRSNETRYWRLKTGYTYRHDFSNLWYFIWFLWRLVDGSLIQRQLFMKMYKGRRLQFVRSRLTGVA